MKTRPSLYKLTGGIEAGCNASIKYIDKDMSGAITSLPRLEYSVVMKKIIYVSFALSLAACGNHSAAHRDTDLSGTDSKPVHLDIKQRVIVAHPDGSISRRAQP